MLAQHSYARFVVANPALLTPIADEQVIDLSLGFMLLAAHGGLIRRPSRRGYPSSSSAHGFLLIARAVGFPAPFAAMPSSLSIPMQTRTAISMEVTQASVLLPTLAFWAAALGDDEALENSCRASRRRSLAIARVQLWLPDEASEPGLWRGQDGHGAAFLNIPLVTGRGGRYSTTSGASAARPPRLPTYPPIKQGFWPLVLVACRHHRLPVPPHCFDRLIQKMEQQPQAIFTIMPPSASKSFLLGSVSLSGVNGQSP